MVGNGEQSMSRDEMDESVTVGKLCGTCLHKYTCGFRMKNDSADF